MFSGSILKNLKFYHTPLSFYSFFALHRCSCCRPLFVISVQ